MSYGTFILSVGIMLMMLNLFLRRAAPSVETRPGIGFLLVGLGLVVVGIAILAGLG